MTHFCRAALEIERQHYGALQKRLWIRSGATAIHPV
jgi:hypothetical protein